MNDNQFTLIYFNHVSQVNVKMFAVVQSWLLQKVPTLGFYFKNCSIFCETQNLKK